MSLPDNLVITDVETGGTDPSKHSITSVAFVIWSPLNPVVRYKEWHVLEDPICVSKSLVRAKGIDVKTCVDFDKLKKYGLPPQEVCSDIRKFLSTVQLSPQSPKPTLVGHNPSFDLGFLKRLFKISDPPGSFPFSHRTIDTHSIAKFLQMKGYVFPEKITSDSLFEHFRIKIPEGERHTALGDAIATAKLLTELLKLL
jgi:DNA polymerase III epsilon subunit-like protein